MKQDQSVTKKYLDKKLEEHSHIIVSAVDKIMSKHFLATEEKFSSVDGGLDKVEEKLDAVEVNLAKKINNVQTLIDAYVKEQEDFKQEFVTLKEEVR